MELNEALDAIKNEKRVEFKENGSIIFVPKFLFCDRSEWVIKNDKVGIFRIDSCDLYEEPKPKVKRWIWEFIHDEGFSYRMYERTMCRHTEEEFLRWIKEDRSVKLDKYHKLDWTEVKE